MRTIILISILLYSSTSIAAQSTVTTIDMTVSLHEEDGSISKHLEEKTTDDPKCNKCSPITLGFAICHALNLQFLDEATLTGERKWARSALGARIEKDKAASLTVQEISEIEKVINKAYPGNYIRQIIPIIDPNKPTPKITD